MPDVIGASRTSDIPRLAEMDRVAGGISATDGGGTVFPGGITVNGTLVTNGTVLGNPGIQVVAGTPGFDSFNAGSLVIGNTNATGISLNARILTVSTVPTVGSGGSGTSALSIVAGSSNTAGQFAVTLTAVAPGVVAGVVAFGSVQPTAPKVVVCSLAAPTAGVAAPPVVGADTYTTAGFTVRVYGPTTVTTGAYIINWWCSF